MHLLKIIKYQLSGQVIEDITYPGQATTMLALLNDFSKSQGLNLSWYKNDTLPTASAQNVGWNVRKLYVINHPNKKGTFSFRVPLKHIFGFCEDYNKLVYRMKHTLTLTRNGDEYAICRDNAAAAGKITLDKILWYMPHVEPADMERMELFTIIERKEKIPVGYRYIQCASNIVPKSM